MRGSNAPRARGGCGFPGPQTGRMCNSCEQVLKYLARYTHRVALSNRRLLSLAGERVRFTAKDYAAGGRRVVTLSAEEFLRRWVQHVLPRGFVKIRHYGLLANRGRTERLA